MKTLKNEFFGLTSAEKKYPTDIMKPLDYLPSREKAFVKAGVYPNDYSVGMDKDVHGMSDFSQARSTSNRERILKEAADDTLRGALAGGAVGAGLGFSGTYLAANKAGELAGTLVDKTNIDFLKKHLGPRVRNATTEAIMKSPANPALLLKHPSELGAVSKALRKMPIATIPTLIGGAFGALTGAAAGKVVGLGYKPPAYYDPYAMYKGASEDHAFITETNIQPIPLHTLPEDIEDVIHLKHPALKYMPLVSGAGGMASGALLNTLRKTKPSLHSLLLHGFLGAAAGTLLKREIEKKYAHPYLDKYVSEVDAKYLSKESSEQEYISETGVPILEKRNFPKKLETAVTHKYPAVDLVPTLSTAAGMIIGHGLTKNMKGIVGGAAVGGLAGTVSRMAAIDYLIKPYREKYIQEIDKEYGLA